MNLDATKVYALEPRSWFDITIRRREEPFRDGMTVADLFPLADPEFAVFRIGGRRAYLTDLLRPGDVVLCVESPGEPATVGAFLFEVIVSAAVGAAIGALVSKLIGPPDKPGAIGDESKPSESFTFGGTRTLYVGSGVPMPAIYGERAVGGIVIGQLVLASGSPQPQQVLHLLLALGSGPVESIAGFTTDRDGITGSEIPSDILINENPATSYSGIEMAVRLGTADQDPIPGVPTTSVFAEVGLPLDNETADSGNPAVTDWSNAVVYDMPEDGDGVLVTIGFPGGLYESGGSSLQAERVDIEFRYRRLDSLGVPFGDYWPGGASDPTAGLSVSIERALLAPFGEGVFLQLYDPAVGGTSLITESLFFNTSIGGTNGVWFDSDGDSTWTNMGSTVDAYSVEMWIKPNGVVTGLGAINSTHASVVQITDVFPGVGFSALGDDPDGSGLGASAFKGLCVYMTPDGVNKRPGFYWGDGTGVGEGVGWVRCESDVVIDTPTGSMYPDDVIDDGAVAVVKNETAHVVVTYLRNFDGAGNNRGRIYVNGTLQGETVSTIDFEWPATADLYETPVSTDRGPVILNNLQGAQALAQAPHTGRRVIDRLVFYSRELSLDEIFFKFNAGIGLVPLVELQSVEAWWEMDTPDFINTGSSLILVDRSGNGHELVGYTVGPLTPPAGGVGINEGAGSGTWTSGDWPATFAQIVGVVGGLSTGPSIITGQPLRGRYRIEVQRVDLVEDSDTISDKATVDTVATISTTEFSYPTTALLSLRLPAQDQLANLRPNLSIPVRGLKVPIWDGVDEDNPTFNLAWSQNNAWIALGMLTGDETGLGRFHDLTTSPVIAKWKEWADYCDALVDAQLDPFFPANVTGSNIAHSNSVEGPEFRFLPETPSIRVPSEWKVGDFITVNDMPAAQVSDGWPNGHTLEIFAINPGSGGSLDLVRCYWPTGLAYPPSGASTVSIAAGTINFTLLEPRSQADVVLDDENRSAWESVLDVFHAGRAAPIRIGDRVSVAVQKVRAPVQLFSSANILPGTLKLSSVAADDEFNAVFYRFNDRRKQYRNEGEPVEHSSLNDGSSTTRIERQLSSSVITRRSQIRREGRYVLNLNALTRQWCEFDTWTEGLALEAGDVFVLSGSFPAYGYGGRLSADVALGATTFPIDVDVSLEPGASYSARLTLSDGVIFEGSVSSASGFYPAGSTLTLSGAVSAPGATRDSQWSVTSTARTFQATGLKLRNDRVVTVIGAEYSDDVYDETGFPTLPADSGSELYDPSALAPPPLSAMSVEEVAGPGQFGAGQTSILVSVQHEARDNLSANAGDVVVTARVAGQDALPPVTLGVIPAGSTWGQFQLPGGGWVPGSLVEVTAAPRGKTGAASGPLRARKARITLAGRGPMPDAPRGLTARLSGTSALYTVVAPLSAARARPIRTEIRAGGWVLGQPVVVLAPGETSPPTNAWWSLPTSSAGRSAPKLVVRHEYANGQWSDALVVTSFAPSAPGTVLEEDSFEDGPWDSVTGDSGTVALSELENETQVDGDEVLRFTDASTALTGTWTSPAWDLGSEQLVAVFFATEGCQIHPISIGEFASTFKGRGIIRDWTIEGPISNYPDLPAAWSGACTITLEVAYSSTATPGTDWQEYRPGLYNARSFAFRITVTRPAATWNFELWRGAFRITEPARVVTYGGSF